jgi:hypothetical protein
MRADISIPLPVFQAATHKPFNLHFTAAIGIFATA